MVLCVNMQSGRSGGENRVIDHKSRYRILESYPNSRLVADEDSVLMVMLQHRHSSDGTFTR
jgi:hypothetical protein